MRKRTKSRFAIASLLVVIIALLVHNTLAYYTTKGTVTNIITSGSIRFAILEKNGQGALVANEDLRVIPGDVIERSVSIKNTCAHPFYLRVKPVCEIDDEEINPGACFLLNIDTKNWAYKDGWYYYRTAIQPGQITANLFTTIEIAGDVIDRTHIGKALHLTINAQAVQSEENSIENNDPSTANGWPKE